MIAPILAAAVAVSVATGSWSISTVNGQVHLRTTWSDATGDHSNSEDRDVDANKLGIAVPLVSNGSHVRFGIHREAGDFAFEGWIASGNGGGTYTFAANAAFFDDLRKRGFTIDGDDSMGKELSAASFDLTREYLDDLQRAGIELDINRLITFCALGIDSAYLHDLASAGFSHMEARQYIAFKSLGITGGYIRYLQAHGFRNLTPREVIAAKSQQI
ncbi:MAG: hypothetical protein WCB01_14995 [Candidatus Cybelea sp.]